MKQPNISELSILSLQCYSHESSAEENGVTVMETCKNNGTNGLTVQKLESLMVSQQWTFSSQKLEPLPMKKERKI